MCVCVYVIASNHTEIGVTVTIFRPICHSVMLTSFFVTIFLFTTISRGPSTYLYALCLGEPDSIILGF